MKKLFILVLVIAVAFPVFSANFKTGKTAKIENMTGDLYSSSEDLEIVTLDGDLFGIARTATVLKELNGGITYAGEKLLITGTVARSVRFIGRVLEIDGEVKGDIFFMGQELRINKDAKIGGEVYAAGAEITINGEVTGPVHVGCDEFILRGVINSNANVKAKKIRILEGARIEGNLDYWTQKAITFPEGTIGGKAVFHIIGTKKKAKEKEKLEKKAKGKPEKKGKGFPFFPSWFKVAWFISSLLLGYIAFLLFPGQIKKFNEEIIARPLRAFLLGAASILIILLLIVIFFVLVFTIPMNMVIIPMFLIFLYFGKLLAGFAIGYIILKGIFKKEVTVWLTYPVGLVALVILSFIPYIGWLLMLIARLWGFGGFFYKVKV